MHFVSEAFIVGIFTSIFGFIISTIIMYFSDKNFSIEKYHFWKFVFLGFFITGFLFHITCEITGVNKWYCVNGNACKNK